MTGSRLSPSVLLLVLLPVPVALVSLRRTAFPAEAFIEVPAGFESRNRFSLPIRAEFARQIGALVYSPDGDPIVYEDGEIRLHGDDKTLVLATFAPAVFGSFLTFSPDGETVLFGENSNGDILSVALDGSGVTPIDNVCFNFDLAFAPPSAGSGIAGMAFISALGRGGMNSIWLLDDDPAAGNDEIVADIANFSGPLAFDAHGNLYYATAGADFFAESNGEETGQRIVRFTPGQLAAGAGNGALALTDAEIVVRNAGGLFAMRYHNERIFATNLADSRIDLVDIAGGFAYSVFATPRIDDAQGIPNQLAFRPGSVPFTAGAGPDGGALMVAYGNFVDVSRIDEIVPHAPFFRGFVNGDGQLDVSDPIHILGFLHLGGPPPMPLEAGDVNGDGVTDLSDAVFLLDYLFLGGLRPPAPFAVF